MRTPSDPDPDAQKDAPPEGLKSIWANKSSPEEAAAAERANSPIWSKDSISVGTTKNGINPWVAAGLSMIIPGIGQLFVSNNNSRAAVILVVGVCLAGLVSISSLLAVITVPFWAWNVYDAHKSARHYTN